MREVQVSVTWVTPDRGGRATPVRVPRYVAISRFDEDGPGWPDGGWSVVLEFPEGVNPSASPVIAKAHFLVEEAPHERLVPGTTFTLHEGRKEVARVQVLQG